MTNTRYDMKPLSEVKPGDLINYSKSVIQLPVLSIERGDKVLEAYEHRILKEKCGLDDETIALATKYLNYRDFSSFRFC